MRSSPDSDPALSDAAASTSIDSDKCIRIKRKFRSSSAAAGSVNEVLLASESGRSKDPAAAASSKKKLLDSEEVNLQLRDSSELKLVDWKDCTETELENLLLENIQSISKDAVVKLSSMGYKKNAEVAVVYAIVNSGFRCISSLVKSAEGYLKAAEVLSAEQSYRSSSLPSKVPMEKFALAELVREMLCDRPGMTRADALWCLILTNLDVNAAIALESKPSATSAQEQTASTSASVLASTASKSAGTETVLAQQPSSTSASGTISLSRSSATDCEQEVDNTDLGNPSLAESSDLLGVSSASSGGGADKLEHNEHSACTELSLALVPDVTRTKTDAFETSEAKKRKSAENEAADQEKDRVIKQLQEQVNSLNIELEERTDWARTKVLQAAKRLTKDVSELQKLRAEREEALRAEQSSSKRFLDLENALRKTGTQLDQAKVALRKLDDSNAEIRAELQAAKLSATESVESSREISKREKKSQKQAQSWEKQRAKLQEELAAERRKLVEAQDQLAQTKERQHQAEVRSRQESKAREEAVSRFEAEKLAREQAEAAGRRSVESIQRKSEADSRGLRDEIRKLEQEVRKLRFGSSDTFSSCGSPEVIYRTTYETAAAATDHESLTSTTPVRRDRECVMCLCEEMSVVFLPCAHQVVCIKCNELHQKQGMNDCPSCRTRIQQRIKVYGASS